MTERDQTLKYGFLMYALIAAPFAFLSFYVYRKKCLLLYDGQIEYTGFLKTKRYSVLDVKQIRIMKQKIVMDQSSLQATVFWVKMERLCLQQESLWFMYRSL